MPRRALISVSNKHEVVNFARGLQEAGFDIVSTGGTSRALKEAGISVTGISAVTGYPELMQGRVKTLHPVIHAGILARRNRPDDVATLSEHSIAPIDVVCVNLYPFVEAASRPTPAEALLEEIDVGGPTMVRAAAKNFRDVLVVVDPADYPAVLEAVRSGGPVNELRLALARKAFAHTAAYDTAIAATMKDIQWDGGGLVRTTPEPDRLPETLVVKVEKVKDLRYGENPHQGAAWYVETPATGFGRATVVQGKELSFTNLLDLEAAARIVADFDEPAAAVIKHTNPCGAATGEGIAEAYRRARDADAVSAFGGIAGFNRAIDADAARLLTSTFMEAVVAPGVSDEARGVLATKPNMRVVVLKDGPEGQTGARVEVRSIYGGLLAQDVDRVEEAREPWPSGGVRVVTRRQPTAEEWRALRFAWRVTAHVKSNAVVFTGEDHTRAIGAGQMSRVDAVKVAVMKATANLAGSVAGSDAFFPFRDGLDAIAEAGATAIVQPGGSMRDAEVIAAADERGLAMVFTGRRHFRH